MKKIIEAVKGVFTRKQENVVAVDTEQRLKDAEDSVRECQQTLVDFYCEMVIDNVNAGKEYSSILVKVLELDERYNVSDRTMWKAMYETVIGNYYKEETYVKAMVELVHIND